VRDARGISPFLPLPRGARRGRGINPGARRVEIGRDTPSTSFRAERRRLIPQADPILRALLFARPLDGAREKWDVSPLAVRAAEQIWGRLIYALRSRRSSARSPVKRSAGLSGRIRLSMPEKVSLPGGTGEGGTEGTRLGFRRCASPSSRPANLHDTVRASRTTCMLNAIYVVSSSAQARC